jgi:hypothetical protein
VHEDDGALSVLPLREGDLLAVEANICRRPES